MNTAKRDELISNMDGIYGEAIKLDFRLVVSKSMPSKYDTSSKTAILNVADLDLVEGTDFHKFTESIKDTGIEMINHGVGLQEATKNVIRIINDMQTSGVTTNTSWEFLIGCFVIATLSDSTDATFAALV